MYNGAWEDDKREGKGVLNSFDGVKIYEGLFKKDMKHGSGVEYNLKTGSKIFDGEWLKDQKNGEGVHFSSNINSNHIKGIWKDNLISEIKIYEHFYLNSLNIHCSSIDLDEDIYFGHTSGHVVVSGNNQKVGNGFGLL